MDRSEELATACTQECFAFLKTDFMPRIKSALELLSEEEVWWRPNEESNSAGNLLLHLEGNVRQRIISGVGRSPDARKRDLEFSERTSIPKARLLLKLEETIDEAESVLMGLRTGDLLETRKIQIYEVSVLKAVLHVVEHFSHHTGQILYIAKSLRGRDLGFYRL